MSIANFRPSSILISLGMFLVVLALFFIPEIIDLQSYISKGQLPAVSDVQPEERKEAVARAKAAEKEEQRIYEEWESPLERILVSLETGEAFAISEDELDYGEHLFSAPPEMVRARLDTIKSKLSISEHELEKKKEIKWEHFQRRETQKDIRGALRDIASLVDDLDESKRNSRRTLTNMSRGLEAVSRYKPGNNGLSAPEALGYLEYLEVEASKALLAERVERNHYLRWNDVSFGEPFADRYSATFKRNHIPPFRPQLIIQTFNINHIEGRNDTPSTFTVGRVRGYVRGDDIASVTVYSGNRERGSVSLAKDSNEEGTRSIGTRSRLNAKSEITFVVEDRLGEIYTKSYLFYPRAQTLRYSGLGTFEAPPGGAIQFDQRFSTSADERRRGWGSPGQQRPFFTTMKSGQEFRAF